MPKIKDPVIIAIVIILFVILAGSFRQNRVLSGKNEALRIEEADMELKLQELDIEAKNKIKAYEDKIAELDGAIDSSNTVIENLKEDVFKKTSENKNLSEEARKLKSEVQPIIDANPKLKLFVYNLETQIANKDQIIFTLNQTIEEKDKVIFSLTEKYNSSRGIIIEKDAQIQTRDNLLSIKDLRIAGLEKQIRYNKFWGNVKTCAAWGGLIYIGIDILSGLAKN